MYLCNANGDTRTPFMGRRVERESGEMPEQCPLLYLPSLRNAPMSLGHLPGKTRCRAKARKPAVSQNDNKHPRDKDERKPTDLHICSTL